MNNEQLHRDLGRLEGEVAALRVTVTDMHVKLDSVLARQYKFAGFASVLSAVATFATAWLLK